MDVAILHPGAMGALVGGTCAADVFWASAERSEDTARRAEANGLANLFTVGSAVDRAGVVVSVCPPHAALDVAHEVASHGFDGIYLDANAISPQLTREVGAHFGHFVDGGIVGPPPKTAGTTRLYLSGKEAGVVASLWEGSRLEPRVMDGPPGTASALKMAYAGWTKGSSALLLTMRAYAGAMGIAEDLVAEWELSIPELPARVERTARGAAAKAWRFVGEMEQIASSLQAAGLPAGFHEAAGSIYERLADLKGAEAPSMDEAMGRLADD
jgi:3-hydroxyisobutyrate dehydrogenase-like beta-hydroxyacid dehydrogenase